MIIKTIIPKQLNDTSLEFYILDPFMTINEYCKKYNHEFLQIVTTPLHGYQGIFEDLNHHSKRLNKELWNVHNKNS